jgi:hypothetical protein
MTFAFIDATELRAAEIRRIAPGLALELASLPSGSSAASPDPAQQAKSLVTAFASAHGDARACIGEATDLLTVEGRSLRLELDSENARRFTRYWRETPARLHLCVALRRGSDVEVFTAICAGRIADKPAGPEELGWDRLFVPDGHDQTLAQLVDRGIVAGPRPDAYAALARAVGSGA